MTAVIFAALVWKVIDWLRMLTKLPESASGVVTQALAWLGGIVAVLVGAHAAVASHVVIPGTDLPLHALDGWSIVLCGFLVASLASSAVDIKQAIDNTDSASKPPLLRLVRGGAPPA